MEESEAEMLDEIEAAALDLRSNNYACYLEANSEGKCKVYDQTILNIAT